MTQSDFDFITQLVNDRVPQSPVISWHLPVWYSVLAASAVMIGAAIGLA